MSAVVAGELYVTEQGGFGVLYEGSGKYYLRPVNGATIPVMRLDDGTLTPKLHEPTAKEKVAIATEIDEQIAFNEQVCSSAATKIKVFPELQRACKIVSMTERNVRVGDIVCSSTMGGLLRSIEIVGGVIRATVFDARGFTLQGPLSTLRHATVAEKREMFCVAERAVCLASTIGETQRLDTEFWQSVKRKF